MKTHRPLTCGVIITTFIFVFSLQNTFAQEAEKVKTRNSARSYDQISQTRQENQRSFSTQSNISFIQNKLTLSPCVGSVELSNHGKEKVNVYLKLVGSKAFSIPEDLQHIAIRPESMKRIQVKFKIDAGNIGWPMALNGVYRAGIQVWDGDPTKKMLLDIISVSARGPILVPFLQCMETGPVDGRMLHKGNSPPSITISTVKPGTVISKNTGTVEVSWRVDRADEIWDIWAHPGVEVLEPGTFTDAGAWENSEHTTPSSFSFTYTPGATLYLTLMARNADGEVWEGEKIYYKARIGYHNARCPAGASIDRDELDQIRRFLDNIDGRLRSNALEDLSSFVDEWNRRLDARTDLPSDVRDRYRFPVFADMAYLSGRVGTGSLSDDILNAMRDVLIYVKPNTLPIGFRPGTTSGGDRALCEVWACNGGECSIMGKTHYSSTHRDCNWIAICVESGADDLTLLHELYHYSIGSGDEAKAVAVSCCVFDWIPW